MHQPEDNKNEDELKKHYFSINLDNMSGLNKILKEMLYGPQIDDSLFIQINSFTDAIFATFGENDDEKLQTNVFFGQNSYGQPIYKNKTFVVDKFHTDYVNHLKQHAAWVLSQPSYYKSLFEILN